MLIGFEAPSFQDFEAEGPASLSQTLEAHQGAGGRDEAEQPDIPPVSNKSLMSVTNEAIKEVKEGTPSSADETESVATLAAPSDTDSLAEQTTADSKTEKGETGLAANSIFFCFLPVKNHLFARKANHLPQIGETPFLFRSSQQLPRLRAGPLKGFCKPGLCVCKNKNPLFTLILGFETSTE